MTRRLAVAADLVVALGVLVFLFRPSGPGTAIARSKMDDWRRERVILAEWAALRDAPSVLGSGTEVAMVVFTDYYCPPCRQAKETVSLLLQNNPELAIAVRHLPRKSHEDAREAAAIAVCAESLGAFPKTHEFLFEQVDAGQPPTALTVARGDHRFAYTLETCLGSELPARLIREDSIWAVRLGLRGTPAFVFRSGKIFYGPPSGEALERLILR